MIKTFAAVLALAAAGAVAGLSTGAYAFDDGFFFDIYGGATLPGTSTYNNDGYDYDMLAGAAFGAAAGFYTPVPGLAFKLDVMHSGAEYADYNYGVYNFSVMAVGEYAAELNDTFSLYGAFGVGAVHVRYYSDDYQGWGAGYEAAIGARAKIAEGISAFGELKYVGSFDDVAAGVNDINYPTLNALVGLRFSFD
jgi:opacity protein-like surface antigen